MTPLQLGVTPKNFIYKYPKLNRDFAFCIVWKFLGFSSNEIYGKKRHFAGYEIKEDQISKEGHNPAKYRNLDT